ncbi:MAG: DNA-processing protein DprA [Thiovulaceae bacterium]|nr:DNA-processing protein DprA [Sulfurimonadaceae bacterium]
MRGTIEQKIEALISMKKYPQTLQYSGNLALLEKKKISIVGSRKPSQYTKMMTHNLSFAVISKNKLEYTKTNRNILRIIEV